MIKRLRRTFLWVSMALITLVLALIMILVCRFTWEGMKDSTVASLQAALDGFVPNGPSSPNAPSLPADPNAPREPIGPLHPQEQNSKPTSIPCFVLSIDPQGQLAVSGSSYYDLSDTEKMQNILDAAKENDMNTGVLLEYSLLYYRAETGPGMRYAFTDISSEIDTIRGLIFTCFMIGFAAFIVFFAMMLALSRWMVRPVEDAWARQRQFVADASHELKTPLTVILTNAELLQSNEYDAPARQRFVTSIHTMSLQMRGLVEDLLDMARIDNGPQSKNLQLQDMSQLVEEAALPFEAVYFEADRSLEMSIEPDLSVMADADELRRVVEILLDNGCKYSKRGTTVALKLSRQSHNRLQLRVASQGESLTSQQCRDIFRRFYRVDAARKMNHSYGLGLPIAQAIVAKHKGKIWCESKDGCNTFYVNLPANR